jgi:hypothetical protein
MGGENEWAKGGGLPPFIGGLGRWHIPVGGALPWSPALGEILGTLPPLLGRRPLLVGCHPTGWEYSRHDRDSSSINDQLRDLESHADPCALHDYHRWSINVESYALCFMIPGLFKIWSLISSYHVQSCYRQTHLLIPVTLHPHDLVTRLQAS